MIVLSVEFVGGPLDGQTQVLPVEGRHPPAWLRSVDEVLPSMDLYRRTDCLSVSGEAWLYVWDELWSR